MLPAFNSNLVFWTWCLFEFAVPSGLLFLKKSCLIGLFLTTMYMFWFHLVLGWNFILLSSRLIIIHYHPQKQRKNNNIKPRIKLNHNIEAWINSCVVAENIRTLTMEGISLRTPPPTSPWIFHICKELMTPPFFHKVRQRPPNPSGQVYFNKKRLSKY